MTAGGEVRILGFLLALCGGCTAARPQPANIEEAAPRLRELYHLMAEMRAERSPKQNAWYVGVLSSGSDVQMYELSPGNGAEYQIFYSEDNANSANEAVVISEARNRQGDCVLSSSVCYWIGHKWYDPTREVRRQIRQC